MKLLDTKISLFQKSLLNDKKFRALVRFFVYLILGDFCVIFIEILSFIENSSDIFDNK